MRYMWIVNPTMSPRDVRDSCYALGEGFVVPRIFTTGTRVCWAMITSKKAYEWAGNQFIIDLNVGPWTITACNKQYITDVKHAKYLGCLGEVEISEANAWIAAQHDNFSLSSKGDNRIIWIPLQRNPNKSIPTGDAGYCRHCGNTNAQTPGNRYHPVYRPWPLHVDA